MNKAQVRDIMTQMEKEKPGASIVLPLQTKGEKDTARILFNRYTTYISDTQYPLYKYNFRFHNVNLSRDGVDGFSIDRISLQEHRQAIFRTRPDGLGRDVDVVVDPNLVSLVERQADTEMSKYLRQWPYDEALDESAPEDVKQRFKDDTLTAKEKDAYVKLIDWTPERKEYIRGKFLQELWEGTIFLNYALMDKLRFDGIRGDI